MSFTNIPGERISAKEIPKHTWNADLVYYDGPLISLYRSERGEDVLYVWLDCTATRHRWCIVPISRESLRGYLNEYYSLHTIFQRAKYLLTFDMGDSFKKTGVTRTDFENFPEDYRPEEDSYLSADIATPAAIQLKEEVTDSYYLGLDGDELYVEELSKIQRIFQQLYSFHYGFSHAFRTAVRDRLQHYSSQWSGGFSAVNIFNGMNNVIPSIHRARVTQLTFNSPGHIKLDLLPNLAEQIQISVDTVLDPERFKALQELYSRSYSYFRESGISGFESESNRISQNLTSETKATLDNFVREFFLIMEWDFQQHPLRRVETNPLLMLRMLFAYYRRLSQLRNYVVDGKLILGASALSSEQVN